MSAPALNVEESKAKRIERQQARLRDRGGIFKPAEHNPLLDLLLARGVNGESPSRANSPRRSRSRSASPIRKRSAPHAGKAPETSAAPKKASARRKSQAAVRKQSQVLDQASIAGPSNPKAYTAAKRARVKSTKTQQAPPPDDDVPRPKRKRKVPDPEPEHVTAENSDDEPIAPKPCKKAPTKARTTTNSMSKSKTTSKKSPPDDDEDVGTTKKTPRVNEYVEPTQDPAPRAKKSTKGKQRADPAPIQEEKPNRVNDSKRRKAASGAPPKAVNNHVEKEDSDDDTPLIALLQPTGRTNPPIAKPKEPPNKSKANKKQAPEPDRSPTPPQLLRRDQRFPPLEQPRPPRAAAKSKIVSSHEHSEKHPNDEPAQEKVPVQRKKRRPPEDEPASPSRKRNRADHQESNQGDGESRAVIRKKAPPVPMPNGVKLEPKPRPPAPADDDSDTDPIDFLS
ncbi:hypothetical protein C8Q80DRAFT_1273394 [Daedaleopsis nitida]|nr:hypothetical protein C8Q80DRAFT_1273394 [Daedaleopsis nitida]